MSEKDLEEVGALLVQHSIVANCSLLLAEVVQRLPAILSQMRGISTSRRHLLQLLHFSSQVTGSGRPLPSIIHHSFLHTLHDGVRTFLTSHPVVVEKIKRDDIVKMVAGLRTLILKAVLLSDKFTGKDLQGLLTAYLPCLPVVKANSRQWMDWAAILHITLPREGEPADPSVQHTLEVISKNNSAVNKYFTHQLRALATLRQDLETKNADWALNIWTTIEPKLSQVLKVVTFLLPPSSHPTSYLQTNHRAKAWLLASRLGEGADQEELLNFWHYLCDLRVETSFWESDLVRAHIAEIRP